jgi:hypothetical protein
MLFLRVVGPIDVPIVSTGGGGKSAIAAIIVYSQKGGVVFDLMLAMATWNFTAVPFCQQAELSAPGAISVGHVTSAAGSSL